MRRQMLAPALLGVLLLVGWAVTAGPGSPYLPTPGAVAARGPRTLMAKALTCLPAPAWPGGTLRRSNQMVYRNQGQPGWEKISKADWVRWALARAPGVTASQVAGAME